MNAKVPYILAITIVVIYTGMFVISKAAFDHGMNTFVFIFYRQAAASLLLVPIALLLERNTLSPNLTNASVKLTSATVASATNNSAPVITFCLALLLRMEVVKLRSSSGVAKLAGVALCLAGALVIAFYAGPSLSPVNHHRAFNTVSSAQASRAPSRGTWITGTFLMVLAMVTWSLWIIMQTALLKEYPDKMLVTTVQCVFSVAQSFVAAVVAERDFAKWKLQRDVSLLAVIYTGFVVTGVGYYLQAWCVEIKGPVFLAVWTPLSFVLTIFCSSFFLGEIVHLGSLLWGKSMETKVSSMVNAVNGGNDAQEHQVHTGEDKEETEQVTSTLAIERV
nr:unnamed protein product [Digitaria exilis]